MVDGGVVGEGGLKIPHSDAGGPDEEESVFWGRGDLGRGFELGDVFFPLFGISAEGKESC